MILLNPIFLMERNYAPSTLVVTPPEQGVQSRLSSQAKEEPVYDGLKVSDVRALHDVYKHDKIDSIGIASEQLAERMTKHQKSDFHREFTKAVTAQRKSTTSKN